jgi:hypothetical protein
MEKETIAMNNALTTSVNRITEGQQDLIARGVEDGRKKALRVIQPDNPAAQRIIVRMNELQDAIIDKMRELSLELPKMPCFGIADWQKFYGITLTPKQFPMERQDAQRALPVQPRQDGSRNALRVRRPRHREHHGTPEAQPDGNGTALRILRA